MLLFLETGSIIGLFIPVSSLAYDVTATLSLGNRNLRLALISKEYLYIHSLSMAKMFHKA